MLLSGFVLPPSGFVLPPKLYAQKSRFPLTKTIAVGPSQLYEQKRSNLLGKSIAVGPSLLAIALPVLSNVFIEGRQLLLVKLDILFRLISLGRLRQHFA